MMDERILDIVIGSAAFLILVALLAVLPLAVPAGTGYLVSIVVFILFLYVAGYLVNEKIT